MEKRNFLKSLDVEYSSSSTQRSEFIFGIQSVIEALRAQKEIDKLFIQQRSQSEALYDIINLAKEHNVPVQYVPIQKLNRMTSKNHQGVVAFISPIFFSKLDHIVQSVFEKGESPLLVVLDRVSDVRNFGAIARTAECAGAHALVIPQKGSAQLNSDAVKTSSGALHFIPVCREVHLQPSLTYLQSSGLQVVACTEKTDRLIYELDLSLPTAILIGSEGEGIAPELERYVDHRVCIPMFGRVSSLNASVATAIVLYEAVRQRTAR